MSGITKTVKMTFWGDTKMLAKPVLILVSGKIGVGKTAFARYLYNYLVDDYKIFYSSFASKIKDCAKEYFFWNGKKDEKGRKLLQVLGTEAGREYDSDLWCKHLYWEIIDIFPPVDVIIIDDWRFQNEKEFFESYGDFQIITIRVDREVESNGHISEHSLPIDDGYFDEVVINNGTLEELKSYAKDFIKRRF